MPSKTISTNDDKNFIEIWGGIECTLNRVKNEYLDQLEFTGHYYRKTDLEKICTLGIRALRCPILWEKYQPLNNTPISFHGLSEDLLKLKHLNIEPIAGLLHHGSGPIFTNLLDVNFPYFFAKYAASVASHFPYIQYFTPINEPLTTARFSGLYGYWYPHHRNEYSFFKMLLNQLKGVVLAMQEIRKINSTAKLIQTEDLAKVFSTPAMRYQADFENMRRWLTFDILSGRMHRDHPLFQYIINSGIPITDLDFFLENQCHPDIIGANYYITSERFLDENIDKYVSDKHGRNNFDVYADIEAVRINFNEEIGLKPRLKEMWLRYSIPLAVTEIHLNCHREEQMRWFNDAWKDCKKLKDEGIDIKSVTCWSLLGSYGWDKLLTGEELNYETGVYDVSSGHLRETCLAGLIKSLSKNQPYNHPVLKEPGWWKRNIPLTNKNILQEITTQDELIFIISKRGSLGKVFAKHCDERAISYLSLGRNDFNLCNMEQMNYMIKMYKPWAIINCAGYVNVDLAESNIKDCLEINTRGVINLAQVCKDNHVKLLTFSSDLVFNGYKLGEYTEHDKPDPQNIYGLSKYLAEHFVLLNYPETLMVRTSSFFSPCDEFNFLSIVFNEISEGRKFIAANDVIISPTYLPHLVNKCLDLMIDDEKGIFHLTNKGAMTWAQFASVAAEHAGFKSEFIIEANINQMNLKARRPSNSALISVKGEFLPAVSKGINEFVKEYHINKFKSRKHNLIQ